MPGGETYRPKQKSGNKKTFHWGGSILLAEAWFTSIGHGQHDKDRGIQWLYYHFPSPAKLTTLLIATPGINCKQAHFIEMLRRIL